MLCKLCKATCLTAVGQSCQGKIWRNTVHLLPYILRNLIPYHRVLSSEISSSVFLRQNSFSLFLPSQGILFLSNEFFPVNAFLASPPNSHNLTNKASRYPLSATICIFFTSNDAFTFSSFVM